MARGETHSPPRDTDAAELATLTPPIAVRSGRYGASALSSWGATLNPWLHSICQFHCK
jgi:hypothetical protein